MAAESVSQLRVFVDVRDVRRADRDADRRDAPAAADQRATGRRSWRSSARCRISSARTASTSVALRYFNAAGADPDGEIGEDHSPEIHLIPRAIEAATGGRGLQVFGDDYPTPDGTCLRDYVHVTDLADAHVRALEALAGGGTVGGLQPRDGRAALGSRGDRRRRARHRARRCRGRWRRGGPAIRRCCTPAPTRRGRNWAGRRAFPISTRSSARRGAGTGRIRTGIAAHDATARGVRWPIRSCRS